MASRTDLPPPAPDHYAVLGVAPDAPPQAIARAYRTLAKSLHPDVAARDADAFQRATTAYRILRDPATRHAYDEVRRRSVASRRPVGSPVPRPVRLSAGQATAAVWGGVACLLLGVAVAVLTAVLVADSASFRSGSVAVVATIVDGGAGATFVRFTTDDGRVVEAPEPDAANPGVRGQQLAIRYDPEDPTRIRADESTAARDITLGLVALKLLVAGPVFAVVGTRSRARIRAAARGS